MPSCCLCMCDSCLHECRCIVGKRGPVAKLLLALGRHNLHPNHLHIMIDAPGFRKLTTALFPEGDVYLSSDVFSQSQVPSHRR